MAPVITTPDENNAIAAAEASQADKLNMTPGQARIVLERTAGTLAASHGIAVEFVEGACPQTDGRTITLPPPNVTDWEEWLQVRGYIDHETSHILFTDMKEFQPLNEFQRLCLNALEDARVNECMRQRYPGAIENLNGMYRRTIKGQLARKAKGEAKEPPANLSKLGAMQIQVEGLNSMGAPDDLFGDVDGAVALAKQHGPRFIQDVASANSTRDLVQPAKDLAALIDPEAAAQPPSQQPQSGKGEPGGEGQDDGEGSEDDGEGSEDDGDGQGGQGRSDKGQGSTPNGSPLDQAAKDAMGSVGGGAGTHKARRQMTDAQRDEADAKQYARHVSRAVPRMDPWQNLEKLTVANARWTRPEFSHVRMGPMLTDAMRMGAGVRDNLRQALRARTMARKTRDQESGGLDMGKLAVIAARVRDPAVYCKVSPGIAVDTACHVLVDASGSMADTQKWPTCPAAAAIFADAAIGCGAVARVTTYDDADIGYEFCAYGEKPTRTEWVNRMKHAQPSGGTPTGNHIQAAARDLLKRREARKILLVVTDGQPDNAPYTEQMTKTARAAGVEVYTIVIAMRQDVVTKYFGAGAVACPTPGDLRGVLLKILTRCLIRQDGKGGRA